MKHAERRRSPVTRLCATKFSQILTSVHSRIVRLFDFDANCDCCRAVLCVCSHTCIRFGSDGDRAAAMEFRYRNLERLLDWFRSLVDHEFSVRLLPPVEMSALLHRHANVACGRWECGSLYAVGMKSQMAANDSLLAGRIGKQKRFVCWLIVLARKCQTVDAEWINVVLTEPLSGVK